VFPSTVDLSLNLSPAQSLCDGDSLFVTVYNNSIDSLYWFKSDLYIDSTLINSEEHFPFIEASDSILVFVGIIDYQHNLNNSISVALANPNNNQDLDNSNDTLSIFLDAYEMVDINSDFIVACENDVTEINVQDYFQNYLWSNGTINDTTELVLPGYYSVEVIDNNGCVSSDSMEYINHFPQINDIVKCPLEDYNFQLPNNLYSNSAWNTGVTGNSIDFDAEGFYSVITQDSLGCTYYDTLEVSFITVPDMIPFEDTISCTDVFNYTLSYAYSNPWWTSSGVPTVNTNQVNLPPAKYFLKPFFLYAIDTITGCALRDTFTLHTAQTTIVQPATIIPCIGTTLTLEAPLASAYLWNGSVTTQTYDVTTQGVKELRTTDINGCYAYDTIRIYQKFLPQAIIADAIPNSSTEIEFSAEFTYYTDSIKWVYGDGFEKTDVVTPGITTLQKTRTITTTGNYDFYFIAISNCGRDTSNTDSYGIFYVGLDNDKQQEFDLYPNPTNGENIQISNFENVRTISVINEIGQMFISPFHLNSNSVDISNLANGIYFVEIRDKNNNYHKEKLIILRD
jgi:hypothetical protein